MKELTFLTRDGCVNTPKMAHNLDDALKSLGERQGHFRDAGAEAAFR
jgi:hypothetical protein